MANFKLKFNFLHCLPRFSNFFLNSEISISPQCEYLFVPSAENCKNNASIFFFNHSFLLSAKEKAHIIFFNIFEYIYSIFS